MKEKTNLLFKSIQLFKNTPLQKKKLKTVEKLASSVQEQENFETPRQNKDGIKKEIINKRRASECSELDPQDIKNQESWNKRRKIAKTPKHMGQRVLERYAARRLFDIKPKTKKLSKILMINTPLDLIKNGFSHKEENVLISIFETCAFDAFAQILYSLGKDIEYFKNTFNKSPLDLFKYITHLDKFGVDQESYVSRTKLFLNFPRKEVEELNSRKLLKVSCNITDIVLHFFPPKRQH